MASPARPQKPANLRTKGLVTVALLRAFFDQKADKVEMFQPLLTETFSSLQRQDFSTEEIQRVFAEKHGVLIPIPAMRTLLSRACKRHQLRREGGRYFLAQLGFREARSVSELRAKIESEHQELSNGLRAFSAGKGHPVESDEKALALVLQFIEENQIALLLDSDDPLRLTQPASLGAREAAIVTSFLHEVCLPDERLSGFVKRMLDGLVIQNALLLKDYGSEHKRFQNLAIYIDTRFMLEAIGAAGEGSQKVAIESLSVLRTAGVRLNAFSATLDEMRRILSVYERHLGSSEGILSLLPGPLTDHFVGKQYTPSEIRGMSSLLAHDIAQLGINVRDFPPHAAETTLDEKELSTRIAGSADKLNEPRVVHDVNCISGVLTMRKGRTAESFDDAGCAFATTTRLLIGNATLWYRGQGGQGVPPIVSVRDLTTLAWLKNPTIAPALKMRELIALCSASLRPSQKVWDGFKAHLRRIVRDPAMASEEAVMIVADDLTKQMLLNWQLSHDDDEDVDATTVTEIVQRVRMEYSAEASRRIAQEHAWAKAEASRAGQATRQAAEIVRQTAEDHRQYVLRVNHRLESVGTCAANCTFAISALLIISAVSYQIYGRFRPTPWTGPAVNVLLGLADLASLAVLIWGRSLWEYRRMMSLGVSKRLGKWLAQE